MRVAGMQRKLYSFKNVALFIVVATLCYLYIGRFSGRSQYPSCKFAGLTMGTFYRVEIVGHDLSRTEIRATKAKVDMVLLGVNDAMSTYIPESDISRFNVSDSIEEFDASGSLSHVAEAALVVSRESDGAFDPTVGPLVNLWGFGSEDVGDEIPTQAQIDEVRKSVGYQHLSIPKPGTLQKAVPGLQLDLGAVAKGAGVDMVLYLLNDSGYSNVLVEVGGEIAVSGHNKRGKSWKISIETPEMDAGIGEGRYAILSLGKGAVATSGDYRNYKEEDGRHYSHVINPKTGWPVTNGVASVTVVAKDCMTADALATALMVLGPEKGLNFMIKQEGADAMIVVRNDTGEYRDYWTAGFSRYVFQN
jgi:thiamine biosynthesis lipoprotein